MVDEAVTYCRAWPPVDGPAAHETEADMLTGMTPRRRRGRGDARWLLAGYVGLAGFFALEGVLREPGSASSLKASDDDRGTTRMIAIAYGLAVDIPLLARWFSMRPLAPAVAPAGLLVQATGLTVRAWSMQALGRSYSRTLRTEDDGQVVIDTGLYRFVRHPGCELPSYLVLAQVS